MPNYLLVMVSGTIAAGLLIYLAGRGVGRRLGYLVFGILIGISAILAPMMPLSHERTLQESYQWILAPLELNFGLLGDGLSLPVLFTIVFVFGFAALFSVPYIERRISEDDIQGDKASYATYYSSFLLYAGSVIGAVLSTNLIQFYLFFECALVFSWVLVYKYGYGNRERTSLMYFLWTHVGAVSLLLGILASFWQTQSFEIEALSLLKGTSIGPWVGLAITIGILVKIGALGLHGWLPETYSESPAPVSAILGATSVVLGTYTMARLLMPFREILFGVSGWLELWALLTILYAGVMALAQNDTKRLVAYLSMSQMNYCFLGTFTYVKHGVLGAVSYSISHGLAIALLFLVSGAILHRAGTRDMNRLGGLAVKMPSLIIASLAGFLTIGGVPPSVGFKSKFILLTGAFERGLEGSSLELGVAVLAATLATVITLAYEFRTVWRVFYGKIPENLRQLSAVPRSMAAAVLALSGLAILFGLWPSLFTVPLDAYFEHIFY